MKVAAGSSAETRVKCTKTMSWTKAEYLSKVACFPYALECEDTLCKVHRLHMFSRNLTRFDQHTVPKLRRILIQSGLNMWWLVSLVWLFIAAYAHIEDIAIAFLSA